RRRLWPAPRAARFHRSGVVPGRLGAAWLASHGNLLPVDTKTPLQATGEALRARRGGARLGQKQGRGRSADLLHVADILAAPPVDVNSTPAEHGGLSLLHRSGDTKTEPANNLPRQAFRSTLLSAGNRTPAS